MWRSSVLVLLLASGCAAETAETLEVGTQDALGVNRVTAAAACAITVDWQRVSTFLMYPSDPTSVKCRYTGYYRAPSIIDGAHNLCEAELRDACAAATFPRPQAHLVPWDSETMLYLDEWPERDGTCPPIPRGDREVTRTVIVNATCDADEPVDATVRGALECAPGERISAPRLAPLCQTEVTSAGYRAEAFGASRRHYDASAEYYCRMVLDCGVTATPHHVTRPGQPACRAYDGDDCTLVTRALSRGIAPTIWTTGEVADNDAEGLARFRAQCEERQRAYTQAQATEACQAHLASQVASLPQTYVSCCEPGGMVDEETFAPEEPSYAPEEALPAEAPYEEPSFEGTQPEEAPPEEAPPEEQPYEGAYDGEA